MTTEELELIRLIKGNWKYRRDPKIRRTLRWRVWELRLLRTEAYTAQLLKGDTHADRSLSC